MAQTVREHHPDWILWLCLSDREPDGFRFNLNEEPFDRVIFTENLPIENIDKWFFKHNVIELCTAVKGYALNHIFDAGADVVIYIDPDIALFNSLSPVLEALKEHSIVLTPHLVDPETRLADIWENERSALLHGVYNLGFLALKNDKEGRRCATWWQDRLSAFCYESASEGIYTDQRWCDLIPAFFDNVKVLRDPGYNVASWNLSKRKISFDHDGHLYANGSPLRFYHFTKIEDVGEKMVERYMGESLPVIELIKWYRESLKKNEVKGLPKKWWAFGKYSDGTPIEYSHRVMYRSRSDLQSAFPHPRQAGTLLAWLKENT